MNRLSWMVILLVLIGSAWQANATTPGAAFLLAILVIVIGMRGPIRRLRHRG